MVEIKEKDFKHLKKILDQSSYGKKIKEIQNQEENRITPISDWCKHYGVIYDDTGHYIDKVKVKYSSPTFTFRDFAFNFKPNDSSFLKVKGFWGTKKYYHYNINNPDPLLLKKGDIKPIMDSKTYKAILENKLVQELNSLVDGTFLAFIKKYWWLILIIGFAVWYFASGQHLIGSHAVNSTINATAQSHNLTAIRR